VADAIESATRTLAVVGKLLEKLSPDDVENLLSGESKIVVVPRSWRPSNVRARMPAALPISVESVQAGLDASQSRESGIQYVNSLSLTVRQLQGIARELGIQASTKMKKAQLVEHIVANIVGGRLSSDAIREGNW
jgi:hypothetical protein